MNAAAETAEPSEVTWAEVWPDFIARFLFLAERDADMKRGEVFVVLGRSPQLWISCDYDDEFRASLRRRDERDRGRGPGRCV